MWNWLLRVYLADVVPLDFPIEDMEDRILELENLVKTYHGLVIIKTIQKRSKPDYRTYLGSWKLEEIIIEMESMKADVLIVWNILKPHQIYNINEKVRNLWIQAWDRVDLILKIFEKHANSVEARLQIALASIKHMGPRIFGMGMELSRQAWGIGTKWIWETNTERMKRHLQDREIIIKEKLSKYENMRVQHRKSRIAKWLRTVGIVGYTNVGKSLLLNSLTNKWVLVENKLFATLWTNVGKMFIQTEDYRWVEVLLNDTIWFIRELPPQLIQAFKSTLEDSIESDLLLHVVDSSDHRIEEKIGIIDSILKDIWANQQKLYVFNKIDLIEKKQLKLLEKKFIHLNPIFISANQRLGLEVLKKCILNGTAGG